MGCSSDAHVSKDHGQTAAIQPGFLSWTRLSWLLAVRLGSAKPAACARLDGLQQAMPVGLLRPAGATTTHSIYPPGGATSPGALLGGCRTFKRLIHMTLML